MKRQEAITRELEEVGEDMDRLQELIDELEKVNSKVGRGQRGGRDSLRRWDQGVTQMLMKSCRSPGQWFAFSTG